MRKLDMKRLAFLGVGEVLAVGANVYKILRGCAEAETAWFVQFEGRDPVLVHVNAPGRFDFELGADEPFAVFARYDEGAQLFFEERDAPSRTVGDPTESFTTVDHRPAINPQLNAVLQQMKLQDGQIKRLESSIRAQAARPAAPPPEPVEVIETPAPVQPPEQPPEQPPVEAAETPQESTA